MKLTVILAIASLALAGCPEPTQPSYQPPPVTQGRATPSPPVVPPAAPWAPSPSGAFQATGVFFCVGQNGTGSSSCSVSGIYDNCNNAYNALRSEVCCESETICA